MKFSAMEEEEEEDERKWWIFRNMMRKIEKFLILYFGEIGIVSGKGLLAGTLEVSYSMVSWNCVTGMSMGMARPGEPGPPRNLIWPTLESYLHPLAPVSIWVMAHPSYRS